jgi:4-hydroxythreonine-4-phosphate dehydrogenase
LGDPAGIGPELVLKIFAQPELNQLPAELTVVGDRDVLVQTYAHLRSRISSPLVDPDSIPTIDCQTQVPFLPGQGDAHTGAASFTYLQTAIDRTLAGGFDGIVTAPIAKFAWAAAGHRFPGQTEVLAAAAQVQRFGMLFAARSPVTDWRLLVLLATTHIPLSQVANTLTPDLVRSKLDLLLESLHRDFGIASPRITVAGLNPHAGEAGELGREELDWLAPLLRTYPSVRGPISPDTMWIEPGQAWWTTGRAAADAYLALYHDQGLIPVKLLAFDRAVNVTVGLPFVRTSPDHGTAFDLAGQGQADPSSMLAAIHLAAELCQQRQHRQLQQSMAVGI